MPILTNLAEDPSYAGTTIVGVVPTLMAATAGPLLANPLRYLKRYKEWSVADRWEQPMALWLQEHFAFLQQEDLALKQLLPFDAVILGMGEDGHIASLIPGSPLIDEAMDPAGERLLAESPAGWGTPPVARITLTLAALLQSRAIFLLIAGEAKRQVIADARAGADLPVRALLDQGLAPVRIFWTPI